MDVQPRNPSDATPGLNPTERAVNILARSLFRQMREQGYSTDQIIGLSSALIELVRDDLQRELAAE